MSQLERMVDDHTEIRWTEAEMTRWINNLPKNDKHRFLSTLKEAKRRGLNVHEFACKARTRIEAARENNKMSLIDFWSSATIGWSLGGLINGNKKIT